MLDAPAATERRLSRTSGRLPVSSLLIAISRSNMKRLDADSASNLALQSALQILEHHRHQAHVSDFVTHERIAHELRPQRPQMHDARATHKRPDEAHHEINRVIGRKNAQVAHARPEWIQRSQRLALLQIIFMGHHAALGPPAGPRGINDAGHILALAVEQTPGHPSAENLPSGTRPPSPHRAALP